VFFPGGHVLLQIVVRTGIIYLLVLIGVRLSGKREVGQMTPFDLTLLLLLSNSVQNAMNGPDTSLAGGAVAACTLLILNYGVAAVSGSNRRLRRLIQGEPSLLVHDGKVIESHMARGIGLNNVVVAAAELKHAQPERRPFTGMPALR